MNTPNLNKKMPALFVNHGSPMLAVDLKNGQNYTQWTASLPKPKAILVFSAHWESSLITLGEIATHHNLIYDFGGFPKELYHLQYPAPGASWLAVKIQTLLKINSTVVQSNRGIDHGVWVPFLHMWPDANIPLLQISIPKNYSNRELFELGEQLAPLSTQGVVIVGSGMVTHNISHWDPNYQGEPIEWAKAFDDWLRDALVRGDIEQLLDWETQAPHAKQNHPTTEHFRPLLIAAGVNKLHNVSFPIEGFEAGMFSRRSIQFD